MLNRNLFGLFSLQPPISFDVSYLGPLSSHLCVHLYILHFSLTPKQLCSPSRHFQWHMENTITSTILRHYPPRFSLSFCQVRFDFRAKSSNQCIFRITRKIIRNLMPQNFNLPVIKQLRNRFPTVIKIPSLFSLSKPKCYDPTHWKDPDTQITHSCTHSLHNFSSRYIPLFPSLIRAKSLRLLMMKHDAILSQSTCRWLTPYHHVLRLEP